MVRPGGHGGIMLAVTYFPVSCTEESSVAEGVFQS